MNAITIGHDSEFGLIRNGHLISALEVYGEDIEEYPEGRVFADNLNVELAINPVTSLDQFHEYTEALLARVRERGFDLHIGPVIDYPVPCLAHPLSRIAGCMPDESAYTGGSNIPPDFEGMLTATRTVGAHVHAQLNGARPDWYARWMDTLVTLPLLSIEQPSSRREMYGGPGCYRAKEYGGEYRSLSSFWVQEADLRAFVWRGTQKAAALAGTTNPSEVAGWADIPDAIARHDRELARRCFDRLYIYGLEVL